VRLDVITAYCKRIVKKIGKPVIINKVHSYKDAIKGSDFIFIQFRVGGEAARITDDEIGHRHKIPYVETVTVCGLASFLRTYYQMEIIAELVKKHAPDAWVMNFSNPSGALTEALHKLGCKKVVGICNAPLGTIVSIAKELKANESDIFMNWRGLNHLAFVDRVMYKGENVFEKIVENIKETDSDFPKEFLQSIGFLPVSYLKYIYLKESVLDKLQSAEKTRAEEVVEVNIRLMELYKDESLDTIPDELKKRGGFMYSRSVADLIKGIVTNDRSIHYVQVRNGSIMSELPSDAFVEIPVIAMGNDVRGIQVEALPPMTKGLVVTMKQYEQLLIKGAMNRSRREIFNAMIVNPLFGSLCLSEPILNDVLEANKDYLPEIL
jgi:6-phospho-beta-glucosidase